MSRARTPRVAQNIPDWAASLGSRLRRLRSERKVTLATVSEATGVSQSFLSLLEQGRTDVSLGRLLPLLDFYGIDPADLLSNSRPPSSQIVRRNERPTAFTAGEGIDVYIASDDRRHAFLPLVVEFKANSVMENWSKHDGDELLIVLSGKLLMEFTNGETAELEQGDSTFFESQREHRVSPMDAEPASALIITTRAAI